MRRDNRHGDRARVSGRIRELVRPRDRSRSERARTPGVRDADVLGRGGAHRDPRGSFRRRQLRPSRPRRRRPHVPQPGRVGASSVATDGARCGDFSAPCGTLEAALVAAKRRRGVADPAADASIVADVYALPGAHAESAACGVSLGGDPAAAHFHANVSVSRPPGSRPREHGIQLHGRRPRRVPRREFRGGRCQHRRARARLGSRSPARRFPRAAAAGGFASGAGRP